MRIEIRRRWLPLLAFAGMALTVAPACAAALVQGSYAFSMTKSCGGNSFTSQIGQASFSATSNALTLSGFQDTGSTDAAAAEIGLTSPEPFAFTTTTLTIGLFTYHAFYSAVHSGTASTVVFGGIDPGGCVVNGRLSKA